MGDVPNVYGEGILFAFSGLDGRTHWAEPFVASTVEDGLALRFHLQGEPLLRIRLADGGAKALRYRAVTNDLVVADVRPGAEPLVVGFVSAYVVAGRLPPGAEVSLEGGSGNVAVARRPDGDGARFALAYDPSSPQRAKAAAEQALGRAIEPLVANRLDFFHRAPGAPGGADPLLRRTLAKAFSVMKVNVYAPEGPIPTRWTTPDRWPHRDMWLWDSAFHSIGLVHVDGALAVEALEAVAEFGRADGFIPHQMSPGAASDISQPPILAWAARQVWERAGRKDPEFLRRMYDLSARHVRWFLTARRLCGDAELFAWKRGDEAGADNSPRFDGGADLAAVDLSCFLANECRALQSMAGALGAPEDARAWDRRAGAIEGAARKHLWDEARGFFFDRRSADGEWIDVWSHSGLLPLWAGIATESQAERLVRHLTDPKKFWTAAPVPSVARDDPRFEKDMWRGPVWVNINYLIVRGLQGRGFAQEAGELRERTLGAVARWYGRTGVLYEFYDCDDRTPPAQLDRKNRLARGTGLPVIADYHWTGALFADLVLRPEP